MGRPPKLTAGGILDVAWQLMQDVPGGDFSMRDLGTALDVDPAAVYRHFGSKHDLVRALVDRMLDGVALEPDLSDWRGVLRRSCVGLREALAAAPGILEALGSAPPRLANEIRLADTMLGALAAAGLDPARAAAVYHALIELTLGSVVVDGAVVALPDEEREATYAGWRADYAALDPGAHPHAVAAAEHLYRGTADDRFAVALELMIAGLDAVPSP